ncbi:MAG: Fic family protein [Elusimicrobia bacterium]|nr:Fic family protein [Elusimicrobiota bacterium]
MTPISEIVFSPSENKESQRIRHLVRSGRLKKIASKIYSSNLTDSPEKIVRNNLYEILGQKYPNAVVSHRTALEGKPTPDGVVFLTYRYTRKIRLPGVTVRLLQGRGPATADMPFVGKLHIASTARAYLENLQTSRARGSAAKSLPRKEIEDRLERICRVQGEAALNDLRDRARNVLQEIGMIEEFRELDVIIGAILKTKSAGGLESSAAKARAAGHAYDPDRLRLFENLFSELKSGEFKSRKEPHREVDAIRNMAFFEAYFSNYIEGTVFEIGQAEDIVFANKIPQSRPADAHDIMGTFIVVSNINEMSRAPDSFESFSASLRSRHQRLLAGRPDQKPGEFKSETNRAGETVFVEPDLVRGTLNSGFEFYRALEHPLARAMFMMFLVSEVHPFNDGNGRIARVMMNAELVHGGLRRIIIPTVFRDDYLTALRVLSRQNRPQPYIKALNRAQEFSFRIDFSDYKTARKALEKANAFKEPGEGLLAFPETSDDPV